jgi:hypothetical protein
VTPDGRPFAEVSVLSFGDVVLSVLVSVHPVATQNAVTTMRARARSDVSVCR